ncbi:spindle pole antigen [Scheffersomyces stipitis CBS 6054]|uniref:Spindle pole antigen n=1 Tax=Scheffersomyces stipitis (strain ATCC 58785 / CBS 6054 / NBRC 10063 / NRRL Y-11545) TaxID=322104 RepID=A3GHW7_PICST|nr:spindle pole antigen [Scheffersomyces stipitis CBS 6054]EAZ63126.2 spindle pole antigen [Scheffersomyces stipitis CBS 6054]KAG2735521.1 hypothetical protein G9P44_001735 [Scheffersomyces stipitis]
MAEKDLIHHYKVLKQFLDISDDSSSNRAAKQSTRAARAREKLLKLSSAQFKELSTDVYDELRRRIDESRGEPDYLLPKSQFHPKRNQARQKLASLPQTRFKDLVSDISFEIERRNLHVEQLAPSSQTQNQYQNQNLHQSQHQHQKENNHRHQQSVSSSHLGTTNSVSDRSRDHTSHEHETPKSVNESDLIDTSMASTATDANNHSIGIQSKTLVPTKANLTWSSDEESDAEDLEHKQNGEHEDEHTHKDEHSHSRDIGGSSTSAGVDSGLAAGAVATGAGVAAVGVAGASLVHHDHNLREENENLKSTIAQLTTNLAALEEKHNGLNEAHEKLQGDHESLLVQHRNVNDNLDKLHQEKNLLLEKEKSSDIQGYEEEINKLKSVNASLRLENQSLKSSTREVGNSPLRSNAGIPNISRDLSQNASEDLPETTKANRAKDISTFFDKLDNLGPKPVSQKYSPPLKNELEFWQKKFEEARSNTISNKISTRSLSSDKLSSLVSPSGLLSIKLVADLQSLIESFLISLNEQNVDSDTLFDKISKLSIIANEIANQGDHSRRNTNEFSVVLRESVSYGLTATRYYAMYTTILPKVIVERAVGEISFSLCDLVSSVKLRESSSETRKIEPSTPEVSRQIKTTNDDFGVRPLRMANKLREIQNQQSFSSPSEEPVGKIDNDPVAKSIDIPIVRESPIEKPLGESSLVVDENQAENEVHQAENEVQAENRSIQNNEPLVEETPIVQDVTTKDLDNVTEKQPNPSTEDEEPIANPNLSTPQKTRSLKSLIPNAFTAFRAKQQESSPKREDSLKANDVKSSPSRGSPRGAHISELTSKFEHKDESANNDAVIRGSPNSTPIKKKILDKVRQFESPTDDSASTKSLSPAYSKNARYSFESDVDSPFKVADKKVLSEPFELGKTEEEVAVPKKGIFQTLREKLATDSDKNADDSINSEDGSFEAEKNDRSIVKDTSSTAETTPSREIEEDNSTLKNIAISADSEVDVPSTTSQDTVEAGEVTNKALSSPKTVVAVPTPSTTKSVKYEDNDEEESDYEEEDSEMSATSEARQRQEYRKSMAAATFNVDLFDIDDPDNTLTQVLLYLEHQTVQVISTIQSLLSAIKKPNSTRGDLREKSKAITEVISQMTEATNTSMNQTRNAQLKEHGSWVVKSLEDCEHRMSILCKPNSEKSDQQFADKNFKQRLAGISFDIAKCTKELVKTVEEASLKEDIAYLENRLSRGDDLT